MVKWLAHLGKPAYVRFGAKENAGQVSQVRTVQINMSARFFSISGWNWWGGDVGLGWLVTLHAKYICTYLWPFQSHAYSLCLIFVCTSVLSVDQLNHYFKHKKKKVSRKSTEQKAINNRYRGSEQPTELHYVNGMFWQLWTVKPAEVCN